MFRIGWLTSIVLGVSCLVACGGASKTTSHDLGGKADMVSGASDEVSITIQGKGTVSNGTTQVCDGTSANCQFAATPGATLSLTGAPAAGYTFTSWQCGTAAPVTTPTLNIPATTNLACTVTFMAENFTLTVNVAPSTAGTVIGTPGIQCGIGGTACSTMQAFGTVVTLSVVAANFYTFTGWGDDCASKTGTNISVTLTANMTCTANFTATQFPLTLSVVGPAGDTTGGPYATLQTAPDVGTCSATGCAPIQVNGGTPVTVTAVPATNYQVDSWSGDCIGSGAASLTNSLVMSSAKTCTLQMAHQKRTLTVNVTGGGHVTTDSGGIDAPSVQTTADYDHGTMVMLTAMPTATGATFMGWGGDCTGTTTPITITMDAAKTCSASFSTNAPVKLTFGIATATQGTVDAFYNKNMATGSPDLSCSTVNPTGCNTATSLTSGSTVTLRANPASGFVFDHWSGDAPCSGMSATITFGTNMDKSCTANFKHVYVLTLSGVTSGNGVGGTVAVTGGGCTASGCSVVDGTAMSITATANSSYRVKSITCTGATPSVNLSATPATATFNISATTSCTVTFQERIVVNGAFSPTTAGTVTNTPQTVDADGTTTIAMSMVFAVSNVNTQRISAMVPSFSTGTGTSTGCTGSGTTVTASIAVKPNQAGSSFTCTPTIVARIPIASDIVGAPSGTITYAADTTSTTCTATGCVADSGSALQATITAPTVTNYVFTGFTGSAACVSAPGTLTAPVSPTLKITSQSAAVACHANYIAKASIPTVALSSLPTPVGFYTDNGAGGCAPTEITWAAASQGEFWCYIAPTSAAGPYTSPAAQYPASGVPSDSSFVKCARANGTNNGQVVTPVAGYAAGVGGEYEIGVQYRLNSFRTILTSTTERFYVHNSLGEFDTTKFTTPICAKKCNWAAPPSVYFNAAGDQAFAASTTYPATMFQFNTRSYTPFDGNRRRPLSVTTKLNSGFVTKNPFVKLSFNKPEVEARRYNFGAVFNQLGTFEANATYNISRLSLRRKFTINANNTLLLVQRQYGSTRGGEGCSMGINHGIDYFGHYAPVAPTRDTQLSRVFCSALVLNNRGEGICFDESGATTVGNVSSSIGMWNKLLDLDPLQGGLGGSDKWYADQLPSLPQ